MKYRSRFILIGLAGVIFTGSFLTKSSAQRGNQVFSHTTPAHREGKYNDCKVCHTLPTRNWMSRRADKEDPFPDVRSYPFNEPGTRGQAKHTTCVGCHANDFYSASFCAGCHSKAGPRVSNSNNVLAFPNRSHGTQFNTVFPHDAHQDIIASNYRKDNIAVGHFVFASFSATQHNKKTEFYNCAVCHKTAKVTPKWDARNPTTDQKPPAAEKDNFKPTADYFKDVPINHASCFTCHYQRIRPISTDCNGCHVFAEKHYIPSHVVERYSLKFSHEQLGKNSQVGERVHAKDCMTCHLRTAGSSDLQALKNKKEPEVPFSTCASCHESDIKDQFDKREKNKLFQCNYCHTSAIGRHEIPSSHL